MGGDTKRFQSNGISEQNDKFSARTKNITSPYFRSKLASGEASDDAMQEHSNANAFNEIKAVQGMQSIALFSQQQRRMLHNYDFYFR